MKTVSKLGDVEFVEFDAGCAIVGDGADDTPVRVITVPAFWISRDPITNAQFRTFVDQGGYEQPDLWDEYGWVCRQEHGFTQPSYFNDSVWGRGDLPVTGVSWYEADAYCRWLGARLPSEWEWERACRGSAGRIFPWGDTDPDTTMANFAPDGDLAIRLPTPADQFPQNVTPEGVRDLCGNFAEWCAESFESPDAPDHRAAAQRVIRGGCALDPTDFLRGSARSAAPPRVRDNLITIRAAHRCE